MHQVRAYKKRKQNRGILFCLVKKEKRGESVCLVKVYVFQEMIMKRTILIFVSLLILGVNIGCDFGLSDPEKKPQPFICDLDGTTMTCTPSAGFDACAILVNRTEQAITAVYAVVSGSPDWGTSLLSTSFPSCSTQVVSLTAPYTWNFAVQRTDGYYATSLNNSFSPGDAKAWNIDPEEFIYTSLKSEGGFKALPSE